MRIEFDALKCAKMLANQAISEKLADRLITTLSETELRNLYSKEESNAMLTEAMKEVLRQAEQRTNEMREDFRRRFEESERRFELEMNQRQAEKRWIVGTIISVSVALAGYLSAVIHFTH